MAETKVFKQIDPNDVVINQFEVYKNWSGITDANYTSSSLDICRAIFPRNELYPGNVIPIGSSLVGSEPVNPDGTYQSVIYDSIKHNQYNPSDSQLYNSDSCQLHLHETASVLSIPMDMVGEGIKHGSIVITDLSTGTSVTIQDDSFGNLYDVAAINTNYPTGSFAYWGFNEKYDMLTYGYTTGSASCFDPYYSGITCERTSYDMLYENIKFVTGIDSTGSATTTSGIMATLNGTGWMEVVHRDEFNRGAGTDFAISMWSVLPTSQSILDTPLNTLISKTGTKKTQMYNTVRDVSMWLDIDTSSSLTPYYVKVYNQSTADSGKLKFGMSDGIHDYAATSSILLNDGQHHIVFQHSASIDQLWIDGVLDTSVSHSIVAKTYNECNLMFGCSAKTRENLSGSLDEIRMFNHALTTAEIATLADNDYDTFGAYQTARIGNVFYKNGICVISDPRPKYRNCLMGQTGTFDYTGGYGFELAYNSTMTIFENRILCRLRQDEFNMSLNPTLRVGNKYNSEVAKDFVASPDWHPYVTTIGLYNEVGELLVVAKLASPLPKYDNVDTTFLVRWDG